MQFLSPSTCLEAPSESYLGHSTKFTHSSMLRRRRIGVGGWVMIQKCLLHGLLHQIRGHVPFLETFFTAPLQLKRHCLAAFGDDLKSGKDQSILHIGALRVTTRVTADWKPQGHIPRMLKCYKALTELTGTQRFKFHLKFTVVSYFSTSY